MEVTRENKTRTKCSFCILLLRVGTFTKFKTPFLWKTYNANKNDDYIKNGSCRIIVCYLMQIEFRFLKWGKKTSQLHVPYRKDLLIHTGWIKQVTLYGSHDSGGKCMMHGDIYVNCPQYLTVKCLIFTYKLF